MNIFIQMVRLLTSRDNILNRLALLASTKENSLTCAIEAAARRVTLEQ